MSPSVPPKTLRVVVLSHGSASPAGAVVAALGEAGVPGDSVILVHNATQPGDEPPALPDDRVRVIRSARNAGYTGGMNLGLEAALEDPGVELVLLLTHDVAILPGTLGALLDAAGRHPDHGILGPCLFDPVRRTVFSYGMRMGSTGGMGHLLEPAGEHDGIVPCDAIDGAFMLIRADVFRSVGTFDERLFVYAEESELCLRARRAGWRVGVVLAARGEQEVGAPRRPGAYAYLMTRNGLNLARTAVGWRGILGGFARGAIQLAVHGRRILDPRRPREHKAAAWAAIVGTVRGALDYFRGRWGPPPSALPGLGDVKGT